MDVDKHAEELASTLGVDKQEAKADLESLLQYSVPLEEAKQSVRRKHGDGGGGGDAAPEASELAEITTGLNNVTVTVRVLTVGTRRIQYQGDEQTIREGRFGDETGTISYTSPNSISVPRHRSPWPTNPSRPPPKSVATAS